MRKGRIAFSVVILLGLLAGMAVPVAKAQTQAVTFHVYSSQNLEEIPPDAEGKITIEGTATGDSGTYNVFVMYLCGEEQCTFAQRPPVVYYKITNAISWEMRSYFRGGPSTGYYLNSDYPNFVAEGDCGVDGAQSSSCVREIAGEAVANDNEWNVYNYQFKFSQFKWAHAPETYMTIEYSIVLSTSPITEEVNCSGQYNLGPVLGSFDIAGTAVFGTNMRTALGTKYPAAGEYYVIKVTAGYWQEVGGGAQLRTLEIRYGPIDLWEDLVSSEFTECGDTEHDAYYLQMPFSSFPVSLRVNDGDNAFSTNTGTVTVTVYGVAARTRYPTGCELQYAVGDLIQQQYVPAALQDGVTMRGKEGKTAAVMGGSAGTPYAARFYMLETIGGPANLGSAGYTYLLDIMRSIVAGTWVNDWVNLGTAPYVLCVVSTDMVGHIAVYFAAEDPLPFIQQLSNYYFKLRVQDSGGNYADNSGSIGYRVYESSYVQTTTPGEVPGPTGCSYFSHAITTTGSITIYGSSSTGTALPALQNKFLYALDIQGGPWLDNGVGSYNIQLSDDGGGTWSDLKDYPNLLCAQSADATNMMIYVYGATGMVWKARADDGDSNWGNNSGSINLVIYPGSTTINYWPKCGDNYSLTKVSKGNDGGMVGAQNEVGVTLPGFVVGKLYEVEITDSAMWFEGGETTGSYLVDISDDAGDTWTNLELYPNHCADMLGDYGRFRVFFTATSTIYKLRVRDGDDNFLSNTGGVSYNLYTVINTNPDNPYPPGTDPGEIPPEWVVACNEAYQRPDGIVAWYPLGTIAGVTLSIPLPRVADWLEYVRAAITYYLAWCPQHTKALMSMGTVYETKEPLASILDLMDFVKSIQTTLASYQAAGGSAEAAGMTSQEPPLFSDTQYIGAAGGESNYASGASSGPWDLFMVGTYDPDTNIWFGGQLDMASSLGSTDLSSMDTYQALCSDKFYTLFGIMADPFCSLMSAMRYSQIVTWILLGLDLFVAVFWLLKYLPGHLRRWYELITGNKSAINKAIG